MQLADTLMESLMTTYDLDLNVLGLHFRPANKTHICLPCHISVPFMSYCFTENFPTIQCINDYPLRESEQAIKCIVWIVHRKESPSGTC